MADKSTVRKTKSIIKILLKVLLLFILGLIVLGATSIAVAYLYYVPEAPDISRIDHLEPPPGSWFPPGDPRVAGEFYRREKLVLELDEIPDHVKNAFLA